MNSLNEPLYIEASIRADHRAQRMLFDEYSGRMMKLCQRYMIDSFEAEEAFIKGFKKAFDKLDSFEDRGENSFAKWLSRIMINECLMALRKTHRFEAVRSDIQEIPVLGEGADESDYIYQMILDLPMGYRTVFNLSVIEGYSHKEIADMLQITEGTSRSQLNKARQMLQKKIENLNSQNGTYEQ